MPAGWRREGPVAIESVLEACVYAEDLGAAEEFYSQVLGLELIAREPGRHVFFLVGPGTFLVFNPARTALPEGTAPVHGARGPGHVAFAVPAAELPAWRERLAGSGVAVETEIAWPHGGHSIYFRDPAGNSVELATRSVWGLK